MEMSSDEEEYANEFVDDADEDLSPYSFPISTRSLRGQQSSGSPMISFLMSASNESGQSYESPGMSTARFMFIFAPAGSSYGFKTSRKKHLPIKGSQFMNVKDDTEGQGLIHSQYSRDNEATHQSSCKYSISLEEGQQKVKGHINEVKEDNFPANLDMDSELNGSSDEMMQDVGDENEVKGQKEAQGSKVKSFSLGDNKPIAQLLHKHCEKTDDIIKSIWSTSSKSSKGKSTDKSSGQQLRNMQATDADKGSNAKIRKDQRNSLEKPLHYFNNESDNSKMISNNKVYKGQRSVREYHHGDTNMHETVEDSSFLAKYKQQDKSRVSVKNLDKLTETSDDVTKVTKTDSTNSRGHSLNSSFLWKNEHDVKSYSADHMKSIERYNSIEEDTGPASHDMEDTGPMSIKVQINEINKTPLNRVIKNNQIETESLYKIRDMNTFGPETGQPLFEDNFLKSTKARTDSETTPKINLFDTPKTSEIGSVDSTVETFKKPAEIKSVQSSSKTQSSRSSNMSDETFSYNSFQNEDGDHFSSDFSGNGFYGYPNEDDGYGHMGSSGRTNKKENRKFTYGNKGIQTAFRRMQKMMTGMKTFADESGFQICDVSNDGNCMFAAVVDQLNLSGDFRFTTTSLRHAAVKYLEQNPCHEDGSHLASFLDHESWEEYLTRMDNDTEWGDHLILMAIVEVIQRCITVYNVSPTTKSDTTLKPSRIESDQSEILYLGHYGEEHFVSLRPKNWENTWYKKAAINVKLKPEKILRASFGESQMNAGKSSSRMSIAEDRNVNSVQEMTDLLEKRSGVDPVSGTPLPHLSYIIKVLLHSKCVKTCPLSVPLQTTSHSCRIEVTGSACEGLNYNLSDLSYYTRCSCSRDPYDVIYSQPLVLFVYLNYKVGFPERAVMDRCDFSINTEKTHPGYARLESVSRHYDFKNLVQYVGGRPFLNHWKSGMKTEHSTHFSQNFVTALEFHDLLSVVSEWICRDRPYKWPSDAIIQEITKTGCVLAAKAHPKSDHPEIEWQFLFSEAEKILATKALSEDQKYCFSVFKVLIDCQTRELEVKLSTHHLKTILFFACEVVSPSYWNDNTGGILLYMIQKLLDCLREGCLPNYFLKDNNMIDHFSVESKRILEEKIEALRMFPVMSMVFIAKRHGILCSSALDSVIDDCNRYRTEGGLVETIQTVFVPSTMKLARGYPYYGIGHQQMFNIINSAYEDLLLLSKSESSLEIPEFPEFFKKLLLSEKSEKKRFLNAFFFDSNYGTSLVESVFQGTKTKALQEVVGMEIEDKYRNLKIPESIISSASSAAIFLDQLAYILYGSQEYETSAYFLRCAIAKVKSEIKEDSINVSDIVDEDIKRDIAKQNYLRIQTLNLSFYEILQHLYCCYQLMKQTDLFLEYMEDLEELSDRMGDSAIYKWVSQLWEQFGSVERANEAKTKIQAVEENSNGCPCGIPNCNKLLVIM